MKYFSCHNHTQYSNIRMLDCINKENKLIDRALELDLCGIAITDHESVGSHIKALKYMEGLRKKAKATLEEKPNDMQAQKVLDFRLALGNEIYLCRDGLSKDNYVKGQDGFWHFILIAKDKEGHKQLRELSSRAWNHTFRQFMERVPTYYMDLEEVILPNPGHIIASTACLGGQFPRMLVEAHNNKDFTRLDAFVNWCRSIFHDDFYIEIQSAESKDQVAFNKLAVAYALKHDLKYIVTTDTHYLKKSDRPIHKSFLNSGDGDREVDEFYEFCYMMDEREIVEHLSVGLPECYALDALKNTHEIYYKIEEYNLAHPQIIPRIPLDWNRVGPIHTIKAIRLYQNINMFAKSEYEEDQYFIFSIINKAKELNLLDEIHLQRIDDECGEIWAVSEKINERLSAYFLIIQKVVELGWTEGDSLVGPWRGSAGALLTSYLLDIIQGDPLDSPAELPYWR